MPQRKLATVTLLLELLRTDVTTTQEINTSVADSNVAAIVAAVMVDDDGLERGSANTICSTSSTVDVATAAGPSTAGAMIRDCTFISSSFRLKLLMDG